VSADGVTFAGSDVAATTGQAVWLWDPLRERILWANAAGLDLWGARDSQVLAARPMAHETARMSAGPTRPATLETPVGAFAGQLEGLPTALADGRVGVRMRFSAATTPPDAQALRAAAFDRATTPMAIADDRGAFVARNAAFVSAFGDGRADMACLRATSLDLGDASPRAHLLEPERADTGAAVSAETLARVAHEFRSPLTAVLGFSEFLRENLESLGPDRVRGYLDDMIAAAERMRLLADNIVALGADGAEKPSAETQLDSVIALALRFAEPLARAHSVTLVQPAATGLAARIDADALGRTITNLVDNAIRHGRVGGRVSATIEDLAETGEAVITIADDGPGLSAQALAEALRPYGRPGRAHGAGPGGLGLPIVSDLVASFGGRLDIVTSPGAGLRARVALPRALIVRRPEPVSAP
jgi:signal transduction histidine kinase